MEYKRIIPFFSIIAALLALPLVGGAQELRFRADGTFHILQLTDIHMKLHNLASQPALWNIDEMIREEQPDLVILTGDVVYSRPADSTLQVVLDRVAAHGVPFVLLFGNHDEERGMTNSELYDIARRTKGCIMPDRAKAASPDYTLSVLSHDGRHTAAVIYCMDSHNHSTLPGVKGYAWITPEQVDWYNHVSDFYTSANDGKPLPAVAFFHIPLPEYSYALTDGNDILVGHRMEKVCCPPLNTGLFASMRIRGDVMGIFCGHDHDNDYSVMYHDILLAYGRFSGGNTEYNHLPNGARVIVLKEDQRSFDTWIRVRKGGIENKTTYPDSYVKDNWKERPLPTD